MLLILGMKELNFFMIATRQVFITFPAWLWIDAFDGNIVEISKLVFSSYY
jgi:hypothetical protein